jgi:hypothetical protein
VHVAVVDTGRVRRDFDDATSRQVTASSRAGSPTISTSFPAAVAGTIGVVKTNNKNRIAGVNWALRAAVRVLLLRNGDSV